MGRPSFHRFVVALSLLGGMAAPTLAQTDDELARRDAIWAEVRQACGQDLDSDACQVARLQAVTIVAESLIDLGAAKDRADAPLVRSYAKANEPNIRVAVAYALAMMVPEIEDILVLRELLNDKVPAVRQAARAAYDKSAFRVAMALRERMGPYDRTEANTYDEDALPYDPSALGVRLPGDAAFLEFERDEIKLGAFLFVTGESEDATLANLANASGRQAKPLAEVMTWFPAGTLDRWSNATFFENVRVIALADGTGADAGKPVRLALVYRDVQLEKTGLALQWVPAETIPVVLPPTEEEVDVPEVAAPADPKAIADALRKQVHPDAKPGADPYDTLFWFSAIESGDGVEEYLQEFPQGAYRTEAEAYLATTVIVDSENLEFDPGEDVLVRFRNSPYQQNPQITIAALGAAPEVALVRGFTRGATAGEETVKAPDAPGIYEIRLVAGDQILASSEIRVGDPEDETGSSTSPAPDAVPVQTPPSDAASTAPPAEPTAPVADAAPQPPPPTASTDPYANHPAPTLTLDKTEFALTDQIVVHLKGMPGKASDWVTIVPAGTSDETWADYHYTNGFVDGDLTFVPRPQPGAYEVRVYFDDPAGGRIVRTRAAFTVR
jgi:hypothetical protein